MAVYRCMITVVQICERYNMVCCVYILVLHPYNRRIDYLSLFETIIDMDLDLCGHLHNSLGHFKYCMLIKEILVYIEQIVYIQSIHKHSSQILAASLIYLEMVGSVLDQMFIVGCLLYTLSLYLYICILVGRYPHMYTSRQVPSLTVQLSGPYQTARGQVQFLYIASV